MQAVLLEIRFLLFLLLLMPLLLLQVFVFSFLLLLSASLRADFLGVVSLGSRVSFVFAIRGFAFFNFLLTGALLPLELLRFLLWSWLTLLSLLLRLLAA